MAGLLGSAASDGSMNNKQLQSRCRDLAVTFRGQAIGDNAARAIQAVLPFVTSNNLPTSGLPETLKQLQDVTKVLNDQTKLSGVFSAASNAFGNGSLAAMSALCDALHILRLLALYKEASVDSFSKEYLLGTEKKALCVTFVCC